MTMNETMTALHKLKVSVMKRKEPTVLHAATQATRRDHIFIKLTAPPPLPCDSYDARLLIHPTLKQMGGRERNQ